MRRDDGFRHVREVARPTPMDAVLLVICGGCFALLLVATRYGWESSGYAFCGSARPEPEAPEWAAACPFEYRLIWGVREIALMPGDNLLGRTHDATIWVDHASVSRRHALLRVAEEGATLEDCASKNGTFIGGDRVDEAVPLRDGDRILLGSALLVFRCFARDKTSTATDASGVQTAPLPDAGAPPPHAHV